MGFTMKTLKHRFDTDNLGRAAKEGDLKRVKSLLTTEGDANNDRNDAMRQAAENGHLEVVKFLSTLDGVDAGAYQNYAIRWATENGHLEMVKFLSTLDGVDAAADDNNAIQLAARNGHLEVVKFLSTLDGVDAAADDNYAIRQAAENGHLEVVKFLSTLDGVDAAAGDNEAIQLAASNGHLEVVKFLSTLDGVDAAANDSYAIVAAASDGHLEVVKFLSTLDGVDTAADDNYAFEMAASDGHLEVVKFLLTLDGVDAAANDNFAVRWAAENGHLEVVKFLLTLDGVDATADNNYAIRKSAENGHLEVVKFLLTLDGVDATADNNYAIRKSAENGHLEVAKFLLTLDGVNAAAGEYYAIRKAAQNGHLEVVKFLSTLDGVNAAVGNKHAIRKAAQKGHLEVVKFLSTLDGVDAVAFAKADKWIETFFRRGHTKKSISFIEFYLDDLRDDSFLFETFEFVLKSGNDEFYTELLSLWKRFPYCYPLALAASFSVGLTKACADLLKAGASLSEAQEHPYFPKSKPGVQEALALFKRPKTVTYRDRYELDSAKAKAGGSSHVEFGVDNVSERSVAIKWTADKAGRDREESLLKLLSGKQIAPSPIEVWEDAERHPNHPYALAMEAGDETLYDIISARSLAVNDVRTIMEKLATALHDLHELGIVHCDVKPANIVRFFDGSWRLIDFDAALKKGQSLVLDGDNTVRAATLPYAAPEIVCWLNKIQNESSPPANLKVPIARPALDIWSYGAILFHLSNDTRENMVVHFFDDTSEQTLSNMAKLYSKAFAAELPAILKVDIADDDDIPEFDLKISSKSGGIVTGKESSASTLVRALCIANAKKRPLLHTVLLHPFFTGGATIALNVNSTLASMGSNIDSVLSNQTEMQADLGRIIEMQEQHTVALNQIAQQATICRNLISSAPESSHPHAFIILPDSLSKDRRLNRAKDKVKDFFGKRFRLHLMCEHSEDSSWHFVKGHAGFELYKLSDSLQSALTSFGPFLSAMGGVARIAFAAATFGASERVADFSEGIGEALDALKDFNSALAEQSCESLESMTPEERCEIAGRAFAWLKDTLDNRLNVSADDYPVKRVATPHGFRWLCAAHRHNDASVSSRNSSSGRRKARKTKSRKVVAASSSLPSIVHANIDSEAAKRHTKSKYKRVHKRSFP